MNVATNDQGGVQSGGTGAAASGGVQSGGTGSAVVSGGGTGSGTVVVSGAVQSGAVQSGGVQSGGVQSGGFSPTWREDIAAGDEKLLERVRRYGSPRALAEALVAAQTKISSGNLAPELPANATAEQLTEYRKALGVPDAHTGYDTTLADGLVIGDADKPYVDLFLKDMHAANATPAEVKRALNTYFKMQQQQGQVFNQKIGENRAATMTALQQEYGAQLKVLTNEVDEQGKALPNDLHHKMAQAILPDGTRLGDNVDYLRWRIADALEKNPMATVLPSGQTGAAAEKGLLEEQAALVKLSGDPKSEYWKGPLAAAKQARLLAINEALEKRPRAT